MFPTQLVHFYLYRKNDHKMSQSDRLSMAPLTSLKELLDIDRG